jgi:hypothetical protein
MITERQVLRKISLHPIDSGDLPTKYPSMSQDDTNPFLKFIDLTTIQEIHEERMRRIEKIISENNFSESYLFRPPKSPRIRENYFLTARWHVSEFFHTVLQRIMKKR